MSYKNSMASFDDEWNSEFTLSQLAALAQLKNEIMGEIMEEIRTQNQKNKEDNLKILREIGTRVSTDIRVRILAVEASFRDYVQQFTHAVKSPPLHMGSLRG